MDFNIEFKGPDWKGIERQVVKEANEEVRRRATSAVAGFRCPEHGEPVRFVRHTGSLGQGLQDLGRLEGCCDKALKLAEQRIDHALS